MDEVLAFEDFVARLNQALRAAYPEIVEGDWIFFQNADGAAWVVGRRRFSCNRRQTGRTAIIGRSEAENPSVLQIVPTDVELTDEGVRAAVAFAHYLSPTKG